MRIGGYVVDIEMSESQSHSCRLGTALIQLFIFSSIDLSLMYYLVIYGDSLSA